MNATSAQQVVVIGSSFAGLTAALELRKRLDHRHRIVVLDPREDGTFIPSLVWLPFGLRDAADITFPLAPLYERTGIEFHNTAAAGFDLDNHVVHTADGDFPYDRLMLATGPRLAFEKVPGLGPADGYTQSICNLDHALLARDAWTEFLTNPRPVVIGPYRAAGRSRIVQRCVTPCGSADRFERALERRARCA